MPVPFGHFGQSLLLGCLFTDMSMRGHDLHTVRLLRHQMLRGHPPAGSHPGQVSECQGVVDVDGLIRGNDCGHQPVGELVGDPTRSTAPVVHVHGVSACGLHRVVFLA
ncbi:hypothetical protein DN496_31555 [Burkholderia multivorans]|nr:hypothetical protein DN496_31555 [Burkholderia multivorans]